jgi:hypothetical protein
MTRKPYLLALAAIGAVMAGCQPAEEPVAASTPVPPKPVEIKFTSVAGVPEAAPAAPADVKTLTALKSFQKRPDPFALKSNERQFDRNQESLRVFGETGFTVQYQEPEEEAPKQEDIPEPQPYRRLAGVVVGDSILALIDMGNGQLEVIRPGQQIPNSEWRVISIDSEKAVLRRSGNRTPRQIVVRLESPPPGMGGGMGQPGGFPGAPGGPGGGPGGLPGRPGAPGMGRPGMADE